MPNELQKQLVGEVTQILGVGALVIGVAVSLSYSLPAGTWLLCGFMAFFVGKKLRGA